MQANVILADPAWEYTVWSKKGKSRSAESHYQTTPLQHMAALPVAECAAENCVLFMWATFPTLPDAFALGAAWGFCYKTVAFVWAKTTRKTGEQPKFLPAADDKNWHMGMGYWTRANTEPCLLFTRGKPKRINASVRQLLVAPVREHSRKPDEQYARIEKLVKCETRLELFARERRDGWHSYGNALTGNDLSVDLQAFSALE